MRRRARHSRPLVLTATCLVGTIGLAACGSESETVGAPAVTAPAPTVGDTGTTGAVPASDAPAPVTSAAAETAAAVPDALAFSAPLVGGGTLDLGSLAGKPVVMWFWAPF